MTAVVTIPLNTGCHQEADQRLMTDGRLRTVVNGRLDREGRIRVRAGYTALTAKLFGPGASPVLVAYDISSIRGRLVALGDVDETLAFGLPGPGYPIDIFEYTGLTSLPWRASTGRVAANVLSRLPIASDLRDLGIIGDVPGGARRASSAALNGHVVLAWDMRGDTASSIISQSYARIVLADTSQLLVHSALPIGTSGHLPQNSRATRTATKLVVTVEDFGNIGNTRLRLYGYTYTPGTSTGLTQVATPLITVATILGIYNVCTVNGGDGIALAVVQDVGTGVVQVRRYNASLAVVTPSGGQYANIAFGSDPTAMVIEADVASDTLTVIAVVAQDLRIHSYVLSTGAVIGAPPYGATMQSVDDLKTDSFALGVARYDATRIVISMYIARNSAPTSANAVRVGLYTPATHDESGILAYIRDCAPASEPVVKDAEVLIALRRGGYTSLVGDVVLCSVGLGTSSGVTLGDIVVPAAAPDLGVTASFAEFPADLKIDPGTGLYYWCRNQSDIPQVTELQLGSSARRSMVEMAGALYISGGVVTRYDGNMLTESGWLERPRILSITPSNGSGSLDNSAEYSYVMTWQFTDANGDISRSPVSEPFFLTMGAADDTNTLVGSVPLSMRLNTGPSGHMSGSAILALFWRNTVDLVSGNPTPSALLQLVGGVYVDQDHFPGDPISFVDTVSDTALEANEVVYTQATTPLDNHASQPAKYLSVASEALMASGLPRRNKWNISKPIQPSETISFAQNGVLAFEGRTQRGDIEQAVGFAQSWLLLTRHELLTLQGAGPNAQGVGEFQRSYRIPSDGGMRDDGWRSVVEFGKGIMYQLEDDQLYIWAGGTPILVGQEIRDTMLEFPNVVAAVHISATQSVAIALQNDAGDDGIIALWDQYHGVWYLDDVGVVDALAEHEGRLAYLQGGVVYLEDADYGLGTAVPLTVATGNVAKTGAAGASGVERILLTGVYQGDFDAELGIKYTDDKTFTTCGVIQFRAADGYTAGAPLDQEWTPARDDTSRFELQLSITGTTGTKLAWCNALEVHYDPDDGPKRLGDARRR